MRGGGGGARVLLCCLLSVAGVCPATELVFHVPDVLVRHEAAPDRPVSTGGPRNDNLIEDRHGAAAAARRDGRGQHEGLHYEEFFVEHEISAVDARTAAATLRVEDIPPRVPGCGVCTREELTYCEWQVVADHCCCERRYQEPYSWIPHTCYAGAKPCKPIARDCSFYRRLRDCCCDRRLAEKCSSPDGFVQSQGVALAVLYLRVPPPVRDTLGVSFGGKAILSSSPKEVPALWLLLTGLLVPATLKMLTL